MAKYDVDIMIDDDANIDIDISMLMLRSILTLRLMPMLCNIFLQNCANHLTEQGCNSEEEVGGPHQLYLKPLLCNSDKYNSEF